MKRCSTIFLQAVVVALGIGTLVFVLWEPHLEGRNVGATLYQIYFHDPFLWYVYTASVAFFVALYQAFKLLGYIRHDEAFSEASAKAVRTIKYSAMILVAFILGAEVYFFTIQREAREDIAGGVVIGLFLIFVSALIATASDVLEGLILKR
ncbi:MAG: DUF2975 domain-containing protein [Candidatus Moranbacteria bacterium]|nr:DUF2975 domain-containing protein [Candidatus Moranbacteria bacterium]